MRIIFKIALFFTLFGISAVLLSQSKQFLKAEECYLEGKYEKALIKIEKSKKDKVQAKEPNTYLLESKILLGLNSLEPSAQLKKDAVKAAIKAKTKAKNNQQFISENQDHYKRISQINLNDALNFYNDKRYSKAIVLFKRSLELANDSFAQFMLGKCYLLNRSYRNALPIFDELLNKQYAHFVRSNVKADFLPDAFNLYTKTLSQKGLHDSAEFYLSMGLDMFPDDAGLLAIQKKVWYQQITEFPLSYQLFDFLDRATQTYPFDSIFTFKKNGVYLVFISNNVNAKDEIAADSWVNKLISKKLIFVQ